MLIQRIPMTKSKYVAYYRVSTDKQGRSGLGLEAQQKAVLDYLNGNGWEIVGEFTEIESGKRNDRPKLQTALRECRLHGATLVIAKLDRLARNVAFISNLMDSEVDFVAVDFPQANRLTVHILAAVAEHEREMISQRTKAALAVAKARGVALGNPQHLTDAARQQGTSESAKVRKAKAQSRASDYIPIIETIKADGITTLAAIADAMNLRNVPAPRGGRWQATQVKRVIDQSA